MQLSSDIVKKYSPSGNIIEASRKIKAEFIERGFVQTNMGWLHKEWLEEGIRTNAIAKNSPNKDDEIKNLSVVPEISEETSYEGIGRQKRETKKRKLTFRQYSKWLLFISWKKGEITTDQYQHDTLALDGF